MYSASCGCSRVRVESTSIHFSFHIKKETSTVHGILTSIKRLTRNCLQAINHRFLDWTKPATSSFLSGTLTDFARKKSDLVAENALLRQQLIILRRHVKRPACTRADRMLQVLLARMVRTRKQALFVVQPETDLAVASPGIQALLEVQVQSTFHQTKDLGRDRGFDQGDGEEQSALGSRTYSWRIAQAEYSRLQTHDPEVHETRACRKATRTEVEHPLTHSC